MVVSRSTDATRCLSEMNLHYILMVFKACVRGSGALPSVQKVLSSSLSGQVKCRSFFFTYAKSKLGVCGEHTPTFTQIPC
jgi:hypothetical protein